MGSWIDATIWTDEGFDELTFRETIKPYFERFAYGREKAPTTGRAHLQFRGILNCPVGSDEEKAIANSLSFLGFRHITRTGVRNFDYIYKDDDYFMSWEKVREQFLIATPRGWQQELIEHQTTDREVEIYVDLQGNSGKTFLGKWLESKHRACYIPPLGRASDILSAVMEKPKSRWYIIDMPRAMPFTREFWASVEMVKNGLVYDHRYKYKEIDLGYNPRVSVFCNDVPERLSSFLSVDRIRICDISRNKPYLGPEEAYSIVERPDWKQWEPPSAADKPAADRRRG